MVHSNSDIGPYTVGPGTEDLKSLFKQLDDLRRSASATTNARRARRSYVASVFARLATSLRSRGRRMARGGWFLALSLIIHTLALVVAYRAYAPYSPDFRAGAPFAVSSAHD